MRGKIVVPKPVAILNDGPLTEQDEFLRGFWDVKQEKAIAPFVKDIDWKSLPMYQPHYHRGI